MKKCCIITLIVVGIIFLSLTVHTICGNVFKTHVIKDELRFDIPEGGAFVDYQYFLGNFKALIQYDNEIAYDNFVVNGLYGPYGLYIVHKVDLDVANAIQLASIDKDNALECVEFYLDIPPTYVGGVVWKLEGQTIIYMESPPEEDDMAYLLLERGKRLP